MDQENELLEISGTVENIIYKNEENGYTVLRLKNDSGKRSQWWDVSPMPPPVNP